MCLYSIISQNIDPVDEEWQDGYKVVECESKNDHYGPFFFFMYDMKCVNIDKKEVFIQTEAPDDFIQLYYKTGFHIWKNLDSAEKDKHWLEFHRHDEYAIYKVRYRKVTAVGNNALDTNSTIFGEAVVAREMKFMEKI